MTGVLLAAIIPNLLAAVFNFFYNRLEIIEHLQDSQATFWRTQLVINSIAFPLGLLFSVLLTWPVAAVVCPTLRAAKQFAVLPAEELRRLRKRCLALGNYAAGLSLGMWLLAAPAYPLAINLGGHDVPSTAYLHFVASLALCGLITSSYPFFGVACLAMCAYYPALIRLDTFQRGESEALARLIRWSWVYLLLATSVPMLSVAILVLIGSQARYALSLLAVGGLAGLAIAFVLFRMLQTDLTALTQIAAPPDEFE